jgi:hypothetical protein
MSLFSRIFGGAKAEVSSSGSVAAVGDADAAIRDARAGRTTIPEMLQRVMAAQVFVPLADAPVMEGASISRWKPATVTKPTDGAQFVVAFTDPALMTAFARSNPQYSYGFAVLASWLVGALPPGHGIVFNPGADHALEWTAATIATYQSKQDD